MSVSTSCMSAWWVGVAPMLLGSDSLCTMGDSARGGIGFVARSGKTSRTDASSCLVRGAARRFSLVMCGWIYFLAHSSRASWGVTSPSSSKVIVVDIHHEREEFACEGCDCNRRGDAVLACVSSAYMHLHGGVLIFKLPYRFWGVDISSVYPFVI